MRGKGEGSVYQDKRGLWTAVVELPARDGTRRRRWIRAKRKADVLDRLVALKAELKLRGDLPTRDQTVKQFFTYWYQDVVLRERRPKTAGGYKSVIDNWIIPNIGTTKLEKVTASTVRKVTDAMLSADPPKSSTYALNAHRIMAAAFEVAVKEGRIGRNPAKLTNAPRKAVAPQDAFTLAESLRMLEYVSRDENGARWATGLLTGARRGEVIGLELDRVGDVLDLSWQLQRLNLTKTGKPIAPADYEYRHVEGGLYLTRPKSRAGWRVIPLVDPLKSILERHLATMEPNPWGLVFVRDGKPIDPDQHTKDWQAVRAGLGIDKNVKLHGLRHTAVDLMLMAGVPEDMIMEIVGHSTRITTRGYKTPQNIERLQAAMERFSLPFTQTDTQRAIGE